MLCSDCMKKIYENLTREELAIFYYIYGREKKVKEAMNAEKNANKFINVINDNKTITNAVCINSNKVRETLNFFYKIGAITRNKKDHTWNYSISTEGYVLIKYLEGDTKKLNNVVNYLKEVSHHA